jgi:hypothetical protein
MKNFSRMTTLIGGLVIAGIGSAPVSSAAELPHPGSGAGFLAKLGARNAARSKPKLWSEAGGDLYDVEFHDWGVEFTKCSNDWGDRARWPFGTFTYDDGKITEGEIYWEVKVAPDDIRPFVRPFTGTYRDREMVIRFREPVLKEGEIAGRDAVLRIEYPHGPLPEAVRRSPAESDRPVLSPPRRRFSKSKLDAVEKYLKRERPEDPDAADWVRAAPPDFRPSAKGRSLSLRLDLESKAIRAGDRLRFRLTARNEGAVSFFWEEAFFKYGGRGRIGTWYYPLREPDGNERYLPVPPMSEELHSDQRFRVRLDPGDSVATGKGVFRDMPTPYEFSKPGLYRLKVRFDDDYSEDWWGEDLRRAWAEKRLGPVESNSVEFEVLP